MQKRGQITIFIVVGIILIALVFGLYFIVSNLQKESLETEDISPLTGELRPQVTSFVEGCIREVAPPGIYLLAIQGGVLYPDDFSSILLTDNNLINYGYLNGVNQLDVEKMERELDQYIEENLEGCLEDFSVFEEQGIEVKERRPLQGEIKIRSNEILVRINYPIEIFKGNDSVALNSFSDTLPLRMGKIVDDAQQIIEEHQRNPAMVDFAFLASFESDVTIIPAGDETLLYSLRDNLSVIDDASLTFILAIKDETVNTAPKLKFQPNLVATKGERLVVELGWEDRENDPVVFSSDHLGFSVSQDGLLDVVPREVGTFFVTFRVTETSGLFGEQEVRIVVVE